MRFPPNAIFRTPAGTWTFAGYVDSRLLYQTKDGSPVPAADLRDMVRSSCPSMFANCAGIVTRSYSTREEAEKALSDLA